MAMKTQHSDVRKTFRGLNRRLFLASSLSSAMLAKTAQAEATSLAEVAASKGILFGAYNPIRFMTNAHRLAALMDQHCKMLVHCYQIFRALRAPPPPTLVLTISDQVAAWAEQHAMKLRGHNIIWSMQPPKWFL